MCVIEIHVRDVNALSERHRIRAKYITIRVCRMSCIGVTTEPVRWRALTGRVLTEVTQVLPGRACVSFSFSGYGET